MKLLNLTLILLSVGGLLACQPRGSSAPGGAPTAPLGTPTGAGTGSASPAPSGPGTGHVGGVDPVGGGNGVEGSMIEDYRVYIQNTDAYKRLQEKVFNKLVVKFPRLAADLKFVAANKRWYIIPTELNTLPSYKIGVSFKTEQYALQTPSEIYIDQRIYKKMSESAQETLLLHEIVMGVRLLVFANPLQTCLVDIEVMTFNPDLEKEYKEKRDSCFEKNKPLAALGESVNIEKKYNLEDSDYPFIRDLTATLANQIDSLNSNELEVWMQMNGFRKYPTP